MPSAPPDKSIPSQEQSKWRQIYLISVVLSIIATGGAAIGRFFTQLGSLQGVVITLSVAVVVMAVAILFLVTKYVSEDAS